MAEQINSGTLLSDEQLRKHLKVYAGPGAGKTYFLVQNIINILQKCPQIVQSDNRKIACITYTNSAVEVIRNRLGHYAKRVEVSTIHSFIFENIIKPFQQDLRDIIKKDFGIDIIGKKIITSQIEGVGILHGIDKNNVYEFIKNSLNIDSDLSYSKNSMGDVEVDISTFDTNEDCKHLKAKTIDIKHIKTIKEYIWNHVRLLTHNEILYFGLRILQENSTALFALRVKFPYIFVDEFQDTNPLQTKIIKLIGNKSTIIGVIGDIAQSIYSFQNAKPTQFINFELPEKSDRDIREYVIDGNRRSNSNIINFCNYLRQSDAIVFQTTVKGFNDEWPSTNIHFLVGDGPNVKKQIGEVIENGGVVLTRTWAAAFVYIKNISNDQSELLKKIYNSYFTYPNDFRVDVQEKNNITWVRAFKFIMLLWESNKTGSFIDVIKAHRLYFKNIGNEIMTPKVIMQIKKIVSAVFSEQNETTITTTLIRQFNELLSKEEYKDYKNMVWGPVPGVTLFDEQEKEEMKSNINKLFWITSYKLFNEVFSETSKYMTVHQAKGLEWDRVLVGAVPTRNDKTDLSSMFESPKLLEENSEQEFTRLYYVACSRAIKELYIHLPGDFNMRIIQTAIDTYNARKNIMIAYDIVEN